MIRHHPEGEDAERENAQKVPPDEGEVEAEQSPLVPFHEVHRALARLIGGEVGAIREDEPAHRIGVRLDDARDDKQQRPQEGKDADEDHEREGCPELFEAREKFVEAGVLALGDFEARRREAEHERPRDEQHRDGRDKHDDRPDDGDDGGRRQTADSSDDDGVHEPDAR